MKKKKGEGGASWMDTYGDMVTLLLCFFVLLYSMSTLDQQKWQALVQSFNPDQIEEIVNSGNPGPLEDAPQTQQDIIDEALNNLYQEFSAYAKEQSKSEGGKAQDISVTKGDGYVFLSFNDTVFFDGDSYILREDGKEVLQHVTSILDKAVDSIDEVQVLGHTAQGSPTAPNNPTVDRFLASNRATVVLVYLQEHGKLPPSRLVSVGYGQWRPIGGNDSATDRARNRRVELIITGLDMQNALGDSITQYYTKSANKAPADSKAAGSAS